MKSGTLARDVRKKKSKNAPHPRRELDFESGGPVFDQNRKLLLVWVWCTLFEKWCSRPGVSHFFERKKMSTRLEPQPLYKNICFALKRPQEAHFFSEAAAQKMRFALKRPREAQNRPAKKKNERQNDEIKTAKNEKAVKPPREHHAFLGLFLRSSRGFYRKMKKSDTLALEVSSTLNFCNTSKARVPKKYQSV